jgi:hypothetical protein
LFKTKSRALSRTVSVLIIVVLVVAVAAFEFSLGSKPNPNAPKEIDLRIIEDNPVLQIDHFYADTIYAPLGANITLAIQNGDDETRVFRMSQFNINVTMSAGTAQRVMFQANTLGNFTFISPITPPSLASNGRDGPCLEGFFYVTQNATLLSASPTTGTGVPPTAAAAAAASAGPVGGCSSAPLTAPP